MTASRSINLSTKIKRALENCPCYFYKNNGYTSRIVKVTHRRFLNLIPYKKEEVLANSYEGNHTIFCYTDEIFEFLDKNLPDVSLVRTEKAL